VSGHVSTSPISNYPMTQQDHKQQQREAQRYDYIQQLPQTPRSKPLSASSGTGANGRTMGGGHGMMGD
jgi:hypothetical protein